MGWTLGFQFVRQELPSASELERLRAAVQRANATAWDGGGFGLMIRRAAEPDGAVVEGTSKLGHSVEESEDAARMVGAINELLAVLPSATLRLHDDYGVFGLDDRGQCTLEGGEAPPPIETDAAQWVDLDELAPPPRIELPASLRKALDAMAGDSPGAPTMNDTAVGQAIAALGRLEEGDPRLSRVRALLETVPLSRRAAIGIKRYPSLGGRYEVREYLAEVLGRIEDVEFLAPDFLAAWRKPKGLYYYGDMQWREETRDRLARLPDVQSQMMDDLHEAERTRFDEELPFRRSEQAALYLARSGNHAAVASLIALLRRWRGGRCSWRLRSYTLAGALEGLGRFPHPLAFATLLLEVAHCWPQFGARKHALKGLALLDPTRALPWLRRLVDARAGMCAVAEALGAIDNDESRAVLRSLLDYPHRSTRDAAAWELSKLGESVVAPEHLPDSESVLLHPDEEVRLEALETLLERADPSLFHSLVLADRLRSAFVRLFDGAATVPSWSAFEARGVPSEVVWGSGLQKLEWLESSGRAVLGAQRIVDAIEPVLREGAKAVAETLTDGKLQLASDEHQALLDEEEAAIAELAGG